MLKNIFGLISRWVNTHTQWLNPTSAIVAGTAGAFIDFQLPLTFQKLHPIQYGVLVALIENTGWITILSSLIFIAVVANDAFHKNTLAKLERKLEREQKRNDFIGNNIKNLFDGYLFHLSNKLEFGTSTNCERITLYIHSSKNKCFIPFGRYSQNPNFAKPGRTEYPEKEGCIWKAWEDGWHFVKLDQNQQNRCTEHQQLYKMKKTVVNKLKMPSIEYAVMRISNSSGKNFGVIVVESTEYRFNAATLKTILEEQKLYLSELIARLKPHIPQPGIAKEKGF